MRDALALRLEVNSSHSRSSRHSSLRPPTLSMSVVAAATTPMEAKKKPLENNKLKTCIQYYYYE